MPELRRAAAALLFIILLGAASAQPQLSGPLVSVRVEGSATYAEIIRTVITPRPGSLVDRIDLEAERNRLYTLGTFEEVSVSLEPTPLGPVLVVVVKENPRIGEVVFDGAEALAPAQLRELLRRQNLIEVGGIYNTTRAESAIGTIQESYRSAGFPFDVPVTLVVEPIEGDAEREPPVRLRYTLVEEEPIDTVVFEGATVFSDEELDRYFVTLREGEFFDPRLFQGSVGGIANAYAELGYRNSGIDLTTTELSGGTLTVRFRELRIAAVDTTAIGVAASELSLSRGDLFNYDVLLEDVRRLALGRSSDVRLVPLILGGDQVRVTFELGAPDTAGPIDDIRIEGNTVVPTEELAALLRLGVGDTFTSTLAQDDFLSIRDRYLDEGYLIGNRPQFNYLDGTYVQRIVELRIADYEISYDGDAAGTEPFVILRYMPAIGEVANVQQIDAGLRTLATLSIVQPVDRRFLPTESPDLVLVNLVLRKQPTGLFQPAATYATDSGFQASLSYSEKDLWGRAHDVSVEVTGQTSDVGLQFGGSVRYSIPWLYVDLLDFQEVPTSVSGSLFSVVNTNQVLSSGGSTTVALPGLPATEANRVQVGEYTVRETGASFSVGRPLSNVTLLRLGARGSFSEYKLEPPSERCRLDDEGELENGDSCSLGYADAIDFLPQNGYSSFVSLGLTYDDRDNTNFPGEGVAANGSVGVGFGNNFRSPVTDQQQGYIYEQVEVGASTYVRIADIRPDDDIEDPKHVFAVRLNGGHQFGGEYPASRRFRVGNTAVVSKQIRGYTLSDFNLSRSYAIGSVEYRYDFGFSTFATQTVIAIVFADLAYVSSVPGFDEYGAPVFGSAGVGVQINLGFGGVAFPALRFDYGFSERNPAGVFSFRIGPVY
jgi:outer membrane protein insertion porin family